MPETPIIAIHKCPVCDGTGLVSRPPWIPGDWPTWTSSGVATYQCKRCQGSGTIEVRDGD